MTEQTKGTIAMFFLICMGIGAGYYLCEHLDENMDFRIDLEKKDYIPYVYKDKLYLINEKNGSTYVLTKHIDYKNKIEWKQYDFVARPKSKKYAKSQFLDTQAKINRLKQAGYSDEKIKEYFKAKGIKDEKVPLHLFDNSPTIIDTNKIDAELRKRGVVQTPSTNNEGWAF